MSSAQQLIELVQSFPLEDTLKQELVQAIQNDTSKENLLRVLDVLQAQADVVAKMAQLLEKEQAMDIEDAQNDLDMIQAEIAS